MSELTAYKGEIYIPHLRSIIDAQVYCKSDADKVIANLEESHKKDVEKLLMEIVKLKNEIEEQNKETK